MTEPTRPQSTPPQQKTQGPSSTYFDINNQCKAEAGIDFGRRKPTTEQLTPCIVVNRIYSLS